jgi:hypothetical protein
LSVLPNLCPKTQSERISDTVDFFSTCSNTPIVMPTDAAVAVAESIRAAMTNSEPPAQPATIEAAKTALQRLSEVFGGTLGAPEPTATPNGPPARVTDPVPPPRVAETSPSPRVTATPPVDNQPIAARTRTAKQDEAIENDVEQYFMNTMHPTSGNL